MIRYYIIDTIRVYIYHILCQQHMLEKEVNYETFKWYEIYRKQR